MRKFFLFFLLGCQFVFGQQQESLVTIIDSLSEKHGVTFSYSSEEVSKALKININLFLELKESIKSIENQTQLVFEKIDEKNYIILKAKENRDIICGKVVDNNNNPISDVVIQNQKQHTLTNSKGFFYLKLNDKTSVVKLMALGYKSQQIVISNFETSCKVIVFEKESIQLDEVVIENYITKGFSKKENGSIAVNINETGVLPGIIEPDVLQTLQFIPGVQSPDETVTGLHIRGSTPDQNLVLYDGVKMYQDAHFFGLLSAFNPYVINNIQLYRSATKARYGGHAGGVISIGVDTTIPKHIHAGISSTLTHVNSEIKIPIFKEKLAVFASVRRGITDISNTIALRNFSEVAFQNTSISNDQFLYQDYSTKLIFQPYKSLQFNFGIVNNQNNLLFEGLNPSFSNNSKDRLNVKSQTLYESISYKSELLGTHNIQLSMTSFDKKFKGLDNFDNLLNQPERLEITFDKENYIEETSIQYNGEKQLFKQGLLQFGFQRSVSEIGYTADTFGKDSRTFRESLIGKETSQSFYTDFKLKYDRLQLNVGGRRQYFNRFDKSFWEPRVFVNYKVLPKLWIKTTYEQKHQSINQITDLRNDGLGRLFNRLWVVSTENSVPILVNNQWSIGLDYQNRGWTLDIEAYSKKIEGIGILLNENINEPKNVTGNNTVRGVDILLKKQWKYYGTWLSYSLLDSKYKFKEINDNRSFNGSFDIPHNVTWTHTLTLKNMAFSLGYKYRSGIPYTQKALSLDKEESNFLTFETYNGERLPDYHRLDLTMAYDFYLDRKKKVKTKIGFTLQNITNQKSILSREFRTIEVPEPESLINSSQPILRKIDRTSIGFTPNFIVRFSI